jgi:hypothetical protein
MERKLFTIPIEQNIFFQKSLWLLKTFRRLGISKGKVISGFLRAFPKKAGHKGARRGSLDGFSAFYG